MACQMHSSERGSQPGTQPWTKPQKTHLVDHRVVDHALGTAREAEGAVALLDVARRRRDIANDGLRKRWALESRCVASQASQPAGIGCARILVAPKSGAPSARTLTVFALPPSEG
jgi:hypothetical protein